MTTKLPVEEYLDSFRSFLQGDLMVFHQASQDAESKEAALRPMLGQTPDTHSIAPGSSPSSSTGTVGTSAPGPQVVAPQPGLFRSTIPHTLMLFATMDFLGFLWGTNPPEKFSTKNIETFLHRANLDQDRINALINIYRHGMVHGFFPKLGLAISYHSNDPQGELFFGRSGNIVLNVDELKKIVLAQLSSIPPSDFPAMEAQYQRMVQHYHTKCTPIIATLNGIIKHY